MRDVPCSAQGSRYGTGGTDLETPVECGVHWRHIAPIRVQIIRVELGRSASQLCQDLGFLKPKVVGSNPTAFAVPNGVLNLGGVFGETERVRGPKLARED